MKPKLYLAGPEVFLPNAIEHAQFQKQLCEKYNFTALHPMDNTIDFGDKDYDTATKIYRSNIIQIEQADIIIANCNTFRSKCVMDDGTAYELGYGKALGKVLYGYVSNMDKLKNKTIENYPTKFDEKHKLYIDIDGYAVIDDYHTSINLMMQCGMTDSEGRLIQGDFEDCLKAIREDIDSGKIKF